MNAIEHLQECRWERPSHYLAYDDKANPVGAYCLYSINRDSSICEESNWEVIKKAFENSEHFYTFRASHWACGWVEYAILEEDAPQSELEEASEIICALADYPILDDMLYSEMQYQAIQEYWENIEIKERIEYCKDAGVSIFQARLDYCAGALFDQLSESIY